MREQLAHPRPALPVLREPILGRDHRERRLPRGHAGQPLSPPDRRGQLLTMPPFQSRLVIEQVHLRRSAVHEQIDDVLGLRREVPRRRERRPFGSRSRFIGLSHRCRHRRERHRPETNPRTTKKLTTSLQHRKARTRRDQWACE